MADSNMNRLHNNEINWFLDSSDEALHDWYELYFPKGYESRLSAFETTAQTNPEPRCSSCVSPSSSSAQLPTAVTMAQQRVRQDSDISHRSGGSGKSPIPTTSDQETNQPQKFKSQKTKTPLCTFCYNNDELPLVYNSHYLKGMSGVISCPILRDIECQFCGATGDEAHTPKYCPKKPGRQW